MMRWDILNHIAARIGARHYLEIGVFDGDCMALVNVPVKWAVDPNPILDAVRRASVFVPKKSLEFFECPPCTVSFDLVFIDGDHRAEIVYEEVQHAIRLLSPGGVVVIHDSSPTTEVMQMVPAMPGTLEADDAWTGDVWKAVVRLRREGVHDVRTVDTDFGVAVVRPNQGLGRVDLPEDEYLTYALLESRRAELLGLISKEEFQAWFA